MVQQYLFADILAPEARAGQSDTGPQAFENKILSRIWRHIVASSHEKIRVQVQIQYAICKTLGNQVPFSIDIA